MLRVLLIVEVVAAVATVRLMAQSLARPASDFGGHWLLILGLSLLGSVTSPAVFGAAPAIMAHFAAVRRPQSIITAATLGWIAAPGPTGTLPDLP